MALCPEGNGHSGVFTQEPFRKLVRLWTAARAAGGGRTREGRTNRVTGQIVPPVTTEGETLLRGSFRSARCFGVSVVKALGKFVGFDVELKIKQNIKRTICKITFHEIE